LGNIILFRQDTALRQSIRSEKTTTIKVILFPGIANTFPPGMEAGKVLLWTDDTFSDIIRGGLFVAFFDCTT
jgi:hypothetical protein